MIGYADLELSLRRKDGVRYIADLVFEQPASDAPVRPLGQHLAPVRFDAGSLQDAGSDPTQYGRALTQMLFGDRALEAAFAQARAVASSRGHLLRVRLAIAPDSPELHALRWETLRSPHDDQPLALSEQTIFTRTLGSADWRPVTLRARSQLRALVAVASPREHAPIDTAAEDRRARAGLGDMLVTSLTDVGQASLNTIVRCLRDEYDILYLVAHGAFIDGEPVVALDDGSGDADVIAGADLTARIADLPTPPRLIVLASCESAGDTSQQALSALGPRLAIAGVPAVLAMQGPLAVETNARFAPTFFHELRRDGQIDRALAAARQVIAQQPDWWAPALFTRLRSGRIWYEPGFEAEDFKKWPALISSIARGRCTPILGPGLLDSLIGSSRDLARRLAERHHFPLAPFARDDLPQVTQYLAVNQSDDLLRSELAAAVRAAVRERIPDVDVSARTAEELLADAGARRRAASPDEPHRVLAGLPLPIFLTANPDSLLRDALREAGKDPQLLICPWNRHGERSKATLDPPTVDHPLVYHLFGRLDDPESLVLTEDDYFRYLIGVTRNEDLLPKVVGSALVNTSLLFLGFRLEDWNFRVLFQSVMNLAGAELRRRYTHVAVQIDPQEEVLINPQAAREYLKSYFGPMAALNYQTNISIYWGSTEDFLAELAQQYVRGQGSA